MDLKSAIVDTASRIKRTFYVKYASIHPEYEVLELGSENIVLPLIDNELEDSSGQSLKSESEAMEWDEGELTKAARGGTVLLADEINKPSGAQTMDFLDMEDGMVIDRSDSM